MSTDIKASSVPLDPKRYTIYSDEIKAAQKKHSIQVVGIPFLLLILAPLYLPEGWFTFKAFSVFAIMAAITGSIGISMGYHRYFAHKAFLAKRWWVAIMAICGQMAGQGSVLYWTALHRRHHSFSDLQGDPHSPSVRARPDLTSWQAFWQGHFKWAADHPVPAPSRYVPDLIKDPMLVKINSHYKTCFYFGLLLSVLVGFLVYQEITLKAAVIGFFWGSVFRLTVSNQLIWAINSVCHTWGSQPYDTGDFSRNNVWMLPFVFGENWHNNHHKNPTYAKFGYSWTQPDPTWWAMAVLKKAGIIWGCLGPGYSAADRTAGNKQ